MSTRPSMYASAARLFLWTLLLSCTAATHAAKFDDATRAPRSADAADFRRHAREYFSAYAQVQKSADDAGSTIRDTGVYDKWLNVEWLLTRSLDDGLQLGDLSEFGLQRKEDGSYTVSVKSYPQWMPIDVILASWRAPGVYDTHAPALKARGFSDQDLATLRNYLDSNNWERAALAENKTLTESFASVAQSRHRARRAVDPEQTMAFVYQRDRNSLEARRVWAIGLLDALDRQRQRILVSYIQELDTTRSYGPPDVNIREHLDRTVAPLISGEYVRTLRDQEMRARQ